MFWGGTYVSLYSVITNWTLLDLVSSIQRVSTRLVPISSTHLESAFFYMQLLWKLVLSRFFSLSLNPENLQLLLHLAFAVLGVSEVIRDTRTKYLPLTMIKSQIGLPKYCGYIHSQYSSRSGSLKGLESGTEGVSTASARYYLGCLLST